MVGTTISGCCRPQSTRGQKGQRTHTCCCHTGAPKHTRSSCKRWVYQKDPIFSCFFLLLVHLQLHYHQAHPDPRLFQATARGEVKLISAGVEHWLKKLSFCQAGRVFLLVSSPKSRVFLLEAAPYLLPFPRTFQIVLQLPAGLHHALGSIHGEWSLSTSTCFLEQRRALSRAHSHHSKQQLMPK